MKIYTLSQILHNSVLDSLNKTLSFGKTCTTCLTDIKFVIFRVLRFWVVNWCSPVDVQWTHLYTVILPACDVYVHIMHCIFQYGKYFLANKHTSEIGMSSTCT